MTELKVKELKNFKDKLTGLINAKKPFAVLIKTRWGIHTFGLKFPIDVLILDKNKRAVKIKINLKPNRILLWPPFFNTVLELPEGSIEKNKIKAGDTIKLEQL